MLTRSIRRSFRRPEGQALVLACLMMLVLSIAVLSTINIGHSIHERVRLQNTADAAAYSMAAMEARAFNFYAFSNRAQVSHYVSAMQWLSFNSFLYGTEAFLTDAYGMLRSAFPCGGEKNAFWDVACKLLEQVPYLGQVIKFVSEAMDLFRNSIVVPYQELLRAADPDWLLGKMMVPTFRVLNRILSGVSFALMMSVHTQLLQTTDKVIEENDRNVDSAVSQVLTGVLSSCQFQRAHNAEMVEDLRSFRGEIDPRASGDMDGRALAKRAMAQVSNASRFPCDENFVCMSGLITNRSLAGMLPLPSGLQKLRQWIDDFGVGDSFGKIGQTKMLSHGYTQVALPSVGKGTSQNRIRDWTDGPGNGIAQLAQGDNLGADDLYWMKFGKKDFLGGLFQNPFSCEPGDDPLDCWGDPNRNDAQADEDQGTTGLPYRNMVKPSIWALNHYEGAWEDGGLHFRVVYPTGLEGLPGAVRPNSNPEEDVGLNQRKKSVGLGIEVSMYMANVRGVEDGNHPWRGLVPFPHFEPAQFENACGLGGDVNRSRAAVRQQRKEGEPNSPNSEFNQPSTWVVLNKSPERMKNPAADPAGGGSNKPAILNEEGRLEVNFFGNKATTLELDNTRKGLVGLNFAKGVNAIARGQTYYHRPGNWTEQPNFFNPYWRPRLAAVHQGLYSFPLLGELVWGLPSPLNEISQKVITH